MVSCGSDDDSNSSNFEITLNTDSNVIGIDELVEIQVTASDSIKRLDISKDNWETAHNLQTASFATQTSIYFDFWDIGSKTISVIATDYNNNTAESTIDVTVERGSAVKINSLVLNSFYNINETWDDEFNDTDPERLADVLFRLSKPRLNPFEGVREGTIEWYESEIKFNQGDLNWDVESNDLYINPNLSFHTFFTDYDGEGFSSSLILSSPYTRVLNISDFMDTQPNPINYQDNSVELDYDLYVEW